MYSGFFWAEWTYTGGGYGVCKIGWRPEVVRFFVIAVDYSYCPFIPILEAVVCDPAEDPSSCPTNRRCEDEDGDGEYNCVCDKRFYTTHTLGHCVLGK